MPSTNRVVSNASPLIYLAKISQLELLKTLFDAIIISPRVHEEVCQSPDVNPDALLIGQAIADGWISVNTTSFPEIEALLQIAGIHRGEAEAILLAKRLGMDLLIDDREGSALAQLYGVHTLGTIAILLLACERTRLSYVQFKAYLEKLVQVGFWISVDVYTRALEKARELLGP